MSAAANIGVGVIGLGFTGRTHIQAYESAAATGHPCRLAAVCDADATRLTGVRPSGNLSRTGTAAPRLFDPASIHTYSEPEALLRDQAVQVVSVCTYTDTHVRLAIAALEAGKHVLVEKPLALRAEDAKRLVDAAGKAKTLCMPAMCMRFWPAWEWLRERVVKQTYGPVRSAAFQRLGAGPTWGAPFYADHSRSGGALVDLHIHDVDFIHWCFGRPEGVISSGDVNHITTTYRYPEGPRHVTAEGAWDLAPGAGFRMRYVVTFKDATVDFDLTREPQLMLYQGETGEAVTLPIHTGYEGEVRHLIGVIAAGGRELRATVAEGVEVLRTLEAERRSIDERREICL